MFSKLMSNNAVCVDYTLAFLIYTYTNLILMPKIIKLQDYDTETPR